MASNENRASKSWAPPRTFIPQVMDLEHSLGGFRPAPVAALSKYSKQGIINIFVMASLTSIAAEFRGLIATSIPQIINLLKDDAQSVRDASVDVLLKFSEHGM
jgi:hypothetical protein